MRGEARGSELGVPPRNRAGKWASEARCSARPPETRVHLFHCRVVLRRTFAAKTIRVDHDLLVRVRASHSGRHVDEEKEWVWGHARVLLRMRLRFLMSGGHSANVFKVR